MEASEHHRQQQELRLGFQSSDPDPPFLTDEKLLQLISDELETLTLAEVANEEAQLQNSFGEELYHLALKQAVHEALENNSLDEDLAPKQALSQEEPHHQALRRYIDESIALRNRGESDEVEDSGGEENRDGDEDKMGNREDKEEEGYNGGLKDGRVRSYSYPLRPDAEDCSFYMRTGMCKFGSQCKFNHPMRRKNQAAREPVQRKEENFDRPGHTECKYYLTSGGCKFGKACRYNHGRGKTAVAPLVEFNFLGLPIRLGERECPYYMRNGSCKYGSNCRFNHPDPTAAGGDKPLSGYGNGKSLSVQGTSQNTMSSWSLPRTLNETAPFVPTAYSPTHRIPPPNPEWNAYQAPVYPSESSLPTPPAFAMNNLATDTNFYANHQPPPVFEEFPERPGQPECSYYMKTGDCKYRSSCKFHHPRSRVPKRFPDGLSDKGLPLRPDQNICTHYSRYGICKFGPSCKYDHPVDHSYAASSAGSEQDNPLSFGNSVADRASMAASANGSL
ncbi:hypothetical protein RJ639_016704 [Escallonia herrerae]|uniref:C3H1-type domain-containing protein n=1 Tax=Escallonia herrerae TaxID=1293975 RepID=A0AA88VCI5_9ASTE|nr:hypothetical protein RJ639_016704 [Escallonia herrerae]